MKNEFNTPLAVPAINWGRIVPITCWSLVIFTLLAFISHVRTLVAISELTDVAGVLFLLVVAAVSVGAWLRQKYLSDNNNQSSK